MSDLAWLHTALISARPQAMSALLRHFRDIELAEEAFQEASLRALRIWPQKGPPRDAAAWLIFVGRNAAIDMLRRTRRETTLPAEETFSETGDAEAETAEQLDGAAYRDDILRLMFICCHPDLPATQQVALALRIVSGLSVAEIARAFLIGESAMEQRITRAKARIGQGGIGFETPGAIERAERLGAVAAMLYLLFNQGYTAGSSLGNARAALSEEAIRLARLLVRLFPAEPEILALLALMLLQQSRLRARFDAQGAGRQPRGSGQDALGSPGDRRGAGAGRQGPAPSAPRPLSAPGGDCGSACPCQQRDGDGLGRYRTALCRA